MYVERRRYLELLQQRRAAATTLQSNWRMFVERRRYLGLDHKTRLDHLELDHKDLELQLQMDEDFRKHMAVMSLVAAEIRALQKNNKELEEEEKEATISQGRAAKDFPVRVRTVSYTLLRAHET